MKQVDVAKAIGRDPAWVSKNLRGPGNWTLRTLSELVEALNGELEISVHGLDDPLPIKLNYHAYAGYEPPAPAPSGSPSAIATPSTLVKLVLDRAIAAANTPVQSRVP
jgi:hypothetical protein